MKKIREIKFRAWDLVTKKFHYVDVWNFHILAENCDDVQQYTGLKDRNGKEMYEGDVAKWDNKYETGTFEVEFSSGYFSAGGPLHLAWELEHKTLQVNNIEIIGNIYENPELLEEECKGVLLHD